MYSFISSHTPPTLTMREIDSNAAFYETVRQLKAMSNRLATLAHNLHHTAEKSITLQDSLKDTGQLLKQLSTIQSMLEKSVLECQNNLAQPIGVSDIYPRTWLITWYNHDLTSIFLSPNEVHVKDDDIAIFKETHNFHARYEIIYAQLDDIIHHFNGVYGLLENIMALNLKSTFGLSTIPNPTIQTKHLSALG